MRTHGKAQPESVQLARRTCLGFLLRVSVVSIRAKQSQTWAEWETWGMLQGGISCETKPNLGRMGDLRDASRRHIVRNKANSRQGRAGRGLGDAGRGADAPNKPNLPGMAGRSSTAPRPSASPPPSRLRQTKPNLGKMGYLEDASRRHIMRNKPNSAQLGAGPTPLRAKRAKQTQFIDCGLRIHKGLWPAAKARAAGCTNKPNWPEPIVPNKPNLPGGAGRCGARSLVQTNPIRPRGRASGVREGKNAQNEANFGRTFKCRVSSGKWGKTGWPSSKSSHFRLRTLHFKLSSRTASGGRT
jgi:hypothetical protein